MSQQANAILAIDSLDRFINLKPTPSNSSFEAGWFAGSLYIIWAIAQPYTSPPIIGALINTASLPPNLIIIATDDINIYLGERQPNGEVIPYMTTNTVGGPVGVLQTYYPLSNVGATKTNALEAQYGIQTDPATGNLLFPQSYNFMIQSPGALIYGYISKIIISQIQIQYNIPTVIGGRNNILWIRNFAQSEPPRYAVIPQGFYTPNELATILQLSIRAIGGIWTTMEVQFTPESGYIFSDPTPKNFYFPTPAEVKATVGLTDVERNNMLKTYRMIGITEQNSYVVGGPLNIQIASNLPNFLYTPYIDIYSDVLTNYQNVKDTTTNITKNKGLVARIYLSGVGNPQITRGDMALGSSPFTLTIDLNSPKIIQWTREVAVPNIDFQLLDQYSEFIPGDDTGFSTEFQMTLLCVEDY